MIIITDKHNCCGCSACASICPKGCIIMEADNEGFLYPNVDKSICIDCCLCEKVCNELHPYDSRVPLKVLAAINENEEIRMKSSSGGIFYILAESIIKEGGVVFGARFDEDWQVEMDYAEDMSGVEKFMGSKYVQARIESAYVDAKRFLSQGRKVLFSGTPCQIAGLHKFLCKPYDNLLTVDLICHGTPSPKVWKIYLEEVIKEGQRINGIEFRNKVKGWKDFNFRLQYNEEDKTVSMLSAFQKNTYMKAFLQDLILRPSCYACKAKGCSSRSDVTIADFWGVSSLFPDMDDDKGTGLVFINTKKGNASLDSAQIKTAETTYEKVKPLNPACYRSPKEHQGRVEFFSRLGSESVISLIDDCTKPSIGQRIYNRLAHCKSLIKRILIGGGEKMNNVIEQTCIKFPEQPEVVFVCFRNKEDGWKGYNVEIRVK